LFAPKGVVEERPTSHRTEKYRRVKKSITRKVTGPRKTQLYLCPDTQSENDVADKKGTGKQRSTPGKDRGIHTCPGVNAGEGERREGYTGRSMARRVGEGGKAKFIRRPSFNRRRLIDRTRRIQKNGRTSSRGGKEQVDRRKRTEKKS